MHNMRALTFLAALACAASLSGLCAAFAHAQSISSAASIVLQLQSQLNVVALGDLSPATDPDRLLGQPGGYTSKATFHDLSFDENPDMSQPSGAVELFGGPRDRDARAASLQTTGDTIVLLGSTGLVRLFGSTGQGLSTYRSALGSISVP